MLSQTAEYALRAALYLAQREDQSPARVGELADALHVPQNYLSKTLHQLTRTGVLLSSRGKGGGFQLARSPDAISLLEIVQPFDRFEDRRLCLLGRPVCSDITPCTAHHRWKDLQDRRTGFFRDTTLAQLIREDIPIELPTPGSLPAPARRRPRKPSRTVG